MKIDVAIIGGGLAGLTTAYLLKNKLTLEKIDIQLTLFEATNRLGGRIYTLREFEDELYAELGAMSIGNNEKEILNLATELEIELIERPDRQKRLYFTQGKWKKTTDVSTIIIFMIDEIIRLKQIGAISEETDWISNEVSKTEILDTLDKITIFEFLKNAINEKKLNLKNPEQLSTHLQASLLGHYASNVLTLSAFDALRFLSQYQETSNVYSVKEGNDRLTTTLYNKIAKDSHILLNTPVLKIKKMENNKFIIKTHCNGKDENFSCDYIIMAVPLTSLKINNDKRIKFKPPLPEQKLQAINHITYNQNVARTYYELNNRFWLEDRDTAMAITDKNTLWIEDHSAHLIKKYAVLEAHAGGSIAQKMAQSNHPANISKELMSEVYGNEFAKACSDKPPITFFWSKQAYQQGAYANLTTGQRQYMKALTENIDNIFFAGEYTAIGHPASMNGAVKSAYRVFDEMCKTISATEIKHKTSFVIK